MKTQTGIHPISGMTLIRESTECQQEVETCEMSDLEASCDRQNRVYSRLKMITGAGHLVAASIVPASSLMSPAVASPEHEHRGLLSRIFNF